MVSFMIVLTHKLLQVLLSTSKILNMWCEPLVMCVSLAQRRTEQMNLAYQNLREGYQITIEPLKSARAAGGKYVATAHAGEAQ